jgi:hypothetical protein
MSAAQIPLGELQHWLLDAIASPDQADRASVSASILPSRQQSAPDRLAVYQHAYLARLLGVLRELFPCTRFAVGDELFDQFAAGYLRQHPPHSYTLARLADKWADFLHESQPADAAWGDFLVELSRLEQAIDRIFDGPGPEQSPPFTLPEGASGNLRLALVPSAELHAFRFPVSDFFTAWKTGEQPAWPEPREQCIALLRRDYIVRRHELTCEQYDLLSAVARGESLAQSLATTTATPDEIRDWFTRWSAAGFFAHSTPDP